jgi:uncharacterized protein (DUF885 family)
MTLTWAGRRLAAVVLMGGSAVLWGCAQTSALPAASAPPGATTTTAPTTAPTTAGQVLARFFADEWERDLRNSPENATYQGDHRFDDRWSDLSLPAIAARQAADVAALAKLRAIPRQALSASEQIDYDTFDWLMSNRVERQKFREHLLPIYHQGGLPTADGIGQVMPFKNAADYSRYLSRLAALPKLVDQVVVLMQEGVKAGLTPPRVLMQRVPAQLAAQVVDEPSRSAFFKPFERMPADMPATEQAALRARAMSVIAAQVVPAYRRLQSHFMNDYLPRARVGIAVSDQPNGQAYYEFLARDYTTTNLSADQIHDIGLKEVARLRAAMEAVRAQIGFKGTLAEFFTHLRTDKKFFYATPAELLAGYQALSKRVDPELLKVFRTLPRMPYGVRAIPDNIAPDTTTAYYQGAALDGTRAGYYYVNLYQPASRPKWEMVPLTLHEAVPGHHFQFARALELPAAPLFRRTAYFVAYGEGWALYAEQLGYEMGLYDDPYDRFGQLTYEMWRAIRLVVDTGMHTKGWSRERAIAYFKDNAAKSELDITNEVDRYIGTPGQALAYKIGQMKISQLRAQAQAKLGEKFDLRDFNDAVLATGSVPLQALERRMDEWVSRQQK